MAEPPSTHESISWPKTPPRPGTVSWTCCAVAILLVGGDWLTTAVHVDPAPTDDRPAPAVLAVLAMLTTCAGLGVLADLGIVTASGTVRWCLPLVPVVAAFAFGVCRLPGRQPPRQP